MSLFNLLAESNGLFMPILLIGLVVLFIVMQIVSGKKRKQEMAKDQERKDKLCAGTKVLTIGGISGEVVSVDHENSTFVLKTATSEILFDKRAIYQMELPADVEVQPVEEVKAVEVDKESQEKKD